MPSSYSYEVGGVVECSKCFKERTMTPEEKLLTRIAELEQELAEARAEIERMKAIAELFAEDYDYCPKCKELQHIEDLNMNIDNQPLDCYACYKETPDE